MNSFLSPRLLEIAAQVEYGASVIDVGSDHAYMPIYLAKEKGAKRALATDVHDGPIQRSRENIEKFGLFGKVEAQKADGLLGVSTEDYDTVVIAGMGGLLIWEILSGAENLAGKRLILQPMTAIAELRQALLDNGFRIEKESIAEEGEKLYVILVASVGEDTPYTEAELLVGRKNKEHPLFAALCQNVSGKLSKRLEGILAGSLQNEAEIERLRTLLEEIRKMPVLN